MQVSWAGPYIQFWIWIRHILSQPSLNDWLESKKLKFQTRKKLPTPNFADTRRSHFPASVMTSSCRISTETASATSSSLHRRPDFVTSRTTAPSRSSLAATMRGSSVPTLTSPSDRRHRLRQDLRHLDGVWLQSSNSLHCTKINPLKHINHPSSKAEAFFPMQIFFKSAYAHNKQK